MKNNLSQIVLSAMQTECMSKVKTWFKGRTNSFVLAGYAGTGKTFLINYIVDMLGIELSNVKFATFTGKASLVMTQKAKGKYKASTLHKLLYEVISLPNGEVEFVKKKRYEFKSIKLIVIDECSMVNKELLQDLYDTGCKLLFVGDNGQLPPVGEVSDIYTRLCESPDFMLTEIHRQALENPIIKMSKDLREGIFPAYGNHGGKVFVIHKTDLAKYNKSMNNADVVICAKNDTRHMINQTIRGIRGFTGKTPQIGEKLACRRNNGKNKASGYTLINGMIGYVKSCSIANDLKMHLTFKPDFFDEYDNSFNSEVLTNKFKGTELPKTIKPWLYDDYEFGYAVTCHTAQGSQWNKVFIVYENLYKTDMTKWLYTSLTRAEDLVILAI